MTSASLETQRPSFTCPAVSVLLADVGPVLQEHPGALQVPERDGQVQGGAPPGVQRLHIHLESDRRGTDGGREKEGGEERYRGETM